MGLRVQGDQADNRGSLRRLCPQALEFLLTFRPGSPPGIVDSGHEDNTGQCLKAAAWGVGREVMRKEVLRWGQLGGLARHSLLPAALWASKPCHRLAESPAPGSHVLGLNLNYRAGLREGICVKPTSAQAESVQGRAYPLPFLPTSIDQSVPSFPSLSFHFYHELFQLSLEHPQNLEASALRCGKSGLDSEAHRLGTKGIATRLKWEGGE